MLKANNTYINFCCDTTNDEKFVSIMGNDEKCVPGHSTWGRKKIHISFKTIETC